MRRPASTSRPTSLSIGRLHEGQVRAYRALLGHRFMALRCGRRFGKTDLAKAWIKQGLVQGEACAWFAPQHMQASEVFSDLSRTLAPLLAARSRGAGAITLQTGGRLDFWSLENPMAGRSRGYHRVVIDEAAFAKNTSNVAAGSMMEIWERSIKPTLYDHAGRALVCSNSAGKNPDNFFYRICTEPQHGFHEYHATTLDNPLLPKRLRYESGAAWQSRRERYQADLKQDNDPLVYAQEYLAEFVDWSGVAFFSREKLLVEGRPVLCPGRCDSVFAIIDTASKTGTEHDATAVTYFAYDRHSIGAPLLVLDWDIVQIEGALLESWLPEVFNHLGAVAARCGARRGSLGAFIEDKNSGTILLQQARRRGMPALAIESKLTALGKDERAISVSGYVHRGQVKYTEHAFNKTATYKRRSLNHLLDQVESFRIGDKNSDREDDLLDTFCYGIALALGDTDGF
ncbi:MAG TPA: hypothetical protein VG889_14085 [Rhizomicrobium sp.]|nr:hypothetical protein [Rhizomicrobium sp.]